MGEKDRIRTIKYSYYLDEKEEAYLMKNSFEYGLTESEYVRKLILYGALMGDKTGIKKEDLENLIEDVRAIGVEINNVAYSSNVKGYVSREDKKILEKLYFSLLRSVIELEFITD